MELTIWQQEEQHLQTMSDMLKVYVDYLKDELRRQKGEIVEERTYASSEFNDVSGENAIQFSQVLQSMELREMSYMNLSDQLAKAEILYKSPYFGRISIVNEEGVLETLYIGLSTFRDPQNDDVHIFDWRAPISSLFYENKVGTASYRIPDGEYIKVEIEGRRQYKVLYNKLLQLFDADIYIGDEVLQNLLNDTAKEKMKSIVATIQSDQNAVIRSSNRDNLIVLGPPGSGKTSVAMQRIAFLLYEYRQTMNARSILLISPSDLFNDYISNVLPELGEENVQHTTYYRLLRDVGMTRYRSETNYENIERLQNASAEERKAYAFKGSHQFVGQLQAYCEQLTHKQIPFYNLKMGEETFVTAKELSQLFYKKFAGLDTDFRLKKIRTLLLSQLEAHKAKEFKTRLKELRKVNKYIGSDEELEQQANNDSNKRYGKLENTVQQLGFVNVHKMYVQALTFQNDTPFTQGIAANTEALLKTGRLNYEDIAPLMYINMLVKKLNVNNTIKHIVIDEIQDYSYLQLLVIQEIHPKAHYTLLGDRNQIVHPEMKDSIATELVRKFKSVELNKSYRSTNEITEYMSAILNNTTTLSLGVSGEKPSVITTGNRAKAIEQLLAKHYVEGDSFVILCKNKAACHALFKQLQPLVQELMLVTEEQKTYMKGILLMPGYMAKGFEFTTVVLADADSTTYRTEMDAFLLYTIASRATRKLFIITPSVQELPKALLAINKDLFEVPSI